MNVIVTGASGLIGSALVATSSAAALGPAADARHARRER